MIRMVLSRLAFYVVAAWAALTLNFLLPRLMPGDPTTAMAGRLSASASPESIAALRETFGHSDAPLYRQYGTYLAGMAVVISFVLGTTLGVLAAWRRSGWLDAVLPPVLALSGAFPYFWLAMLALHLFGFTLGWSPLRHAYCDHLTAAPTWRFA